MVYDIFLPTPSARRATHCFGAFGAVTPNFYPRPPRGGRPTADNNTQQITEFLPTPSARRATCIAVYSG